MVLAQRLRCRRAVEPEHRTGPLRAPCSASRAAQTLCRDVGRQPAFAGLPWSLRAAADTTRLNPFRSGADTGQRVRSTTSCNATARKELVIMNTTVTNATEYRNLPLALL